MTTSMPDQGRWCQECGADISDKPRLARFCCEAHRRRESSRRGNARDRDRFFDLIQGRVTEKINRNDIGHYRRLLLADPCSFCGRPSQELDHIEPVSRGGANDLSNLSGICADCNRSKKSRTLLAHLVLRHEDALRVEMLRSRNNWQGVGPRAVPPERRARKRRPYVRRTILIDDLRDAA